MPHFRDRAYPRGYHGSETTDADRAWWRELRKILVGRSNRHGVHAASGEKAASQKKAASKIKEASGEKVASGKKVVSKIAVFIATSDGKLSVTVPEDATVRDIKLAACSQHQLDVNDYNLALGGLELQDFRSLKESGVKADSILSIQNAEELEHRSHAQAENTDPAASSPPNGGRVGNHTLLPPRTSAPLAYHPRASVCMYVSTRIRRSWLSSGSGPMRTITVTSGRSTRRIWQLVATWTSTSLMSMSLSLPRWTISACMTSPKELDPASLTTLRRFCARWDARP